MQKYDKYDIINVDKTGDIPVNYNGIMGVPITFLDKYNPEQFEIVGSNCSTELCVELGVKPLARFVAGALAGVDPSIMGVGPIAASRKAFEKYKSF